jgi:hypothetical protein
MPELFSGPSGLLCALVVYLVFCPARYDPAIRLKDWLERRRNGRT